MHTPRPGLPHPGGLLRLDVRLLFRQIRRRRRRFGGAPSAKAARALHSPAACQGGGEGRFGPYCNNKPAAEGIRGKEDSDGRQPPSLLCACPERSRKWCSWKHGTAHKDRAASVRSPPERGPAARAECAPFPPWGSPGRGGSVAARGTHARAHTRAQPRARSDTLTHTCARTDSEPARAVAWRDQCKT